jgi:hypothetical protein
MSSLRFCGVALAVLYVLIRLELRDRWLET